jgi:hypothetical protein
LLAELRILVISESALSTDSVDRFHLATYRAEENARAGPHFGEMEHAF